MPLLIGPSIPLTMAMSQMTRSHKWEPFGADEGVTSVRRSALEAALAQLSGLMNRFMGILEMLAKHPEPEPEDDFMRGWGSDELDDSGP